MVFLDHVSLLYQMHQTNMTRGKKPVDLNVARVLKMSLDRRRMQHQGVVSNLSDIPKEEIAECSTQKKSKNFDEKNYE
jgi:hypothetical protein